MKNPGHFWVQINNGPTRQLMGQGLRLLLGIPVFLAVSHP